MSLDINTPRGQSALAYERDCIDLFCKLYPDYRFLETNKQEPAAIDGFFYLHRKQWVDCAVEVKTRDMTTEQLMCDYGNEWLISNNKIERGQRISELICCPFIGMLYLIPEKKILTIKITDNRGRFLIDFDVRKTATSKSINDHKMELGMNAFIPMEKAKEHKWSTEQIASSATT